jgi:quercetin 2,3-dioxygenase
MADRRLRPGHNHGTDHRRLGWTYPGIAGFLTGTGPWTLITLESNRGFEHLLPGRDRAFFYVLSGEVTVAGQGVRAGQIAWSDPVPGATVSRITMAAGDGDRESVVMAYSGQPIGQPVAMGGPFVMNTKTEITQAFNDFRSGKFGDIPRQARLKYL